MSELVVTYPESATHLVRNIVHPVSKAYPVEFHDLQLAVVRVSTKIVASIIACSTLAAFLCPWTLGTLH